MGISYYVYIDADPHFSSSWPNFFGNVLFIDAISVHLIKIHIGFGWQGDDWFVSIWKKKQTSESAMNREICVSFHHDSRSLHGDREENAKIKLWIVYVQRTWNGLQFIWSMHTGICCCGWLMHTRIWSALQSRSFHGKWTLFIRSGIV